jgi:peptidoglycan/xylan/chitin deacetylase (PgdA/CDA1 family)
MDKLTAPLTIVMYHYVRDLAHSRFPAIKGLSMERFRRQLSHIRAHYTPISVEELLQGSDLPPNPVLLTFDDGYADHFTNAFPLLDDYGISACFFPAAQPILEHTVLDVNKIQFALAASGSPAALLSEALSCLEGLRSEHSLKPTAEYLTAAAEGHRYDSEEVVVLKRLLQRELPEAVRSPIVNRLFARHVTTDEAAFACELYMSLDQLACMRRHGMHIGSHGYSHLWMNRISSETQTVEIDRSLDFLEAIGISRSGFTICYPYGGFNDSLQGILRNRGCRLGFTVEPRIADLRCDDPLTLPRLDTNDLPS